MNDQTYKVLMIDDDELIARSTAEYFNILGHADLIFPNASKYGII